MRFPSNGRWWANRRHLSIDRDGTITIQFAVDPDAFKDESLWLELTGHPGTLRNIATAINAHVAAAEVNTLEEAL